MSTHNKRLLMELEQAVKEVNREVLRPEFEKLLIADFSPFLRLVANARLKYLKALIDLPKQGDSPSTSSITELAILRNNYEELVCASSALQTAIERGYLDVGKTSHAA